MCAARATATRSSRRHDRNSPQQPEGTPRARRGRVVDDGAALALGRDRAGRRDRGFDSLYIDLEHSSLSLETTSQICCAALTCGIAPLVRVAQVELIQRVLDGGALGVIMPDVRTAAQAREAVRAAKYPPQGERGFASVLRAAPIPHGADARALHGGQRRHDGDRAVRERRGDRSRRRNLRRRGRRHGAVRHQRSDRRHGHPGRLREPEGARRLRARHRGGEEARQACRRRRARRQAEAHRRVRQDGRALRLDRDGSRLSAQCRDRAGEAGEGRSQLERGWHAPCIFAKLSASYPPQRGSHAQTASDRGRGRYRRRACRRARRRADAGEDQAARRHRRRQQGRLQAVRLPRPVAARSSASSRTSRSTSPTSSA